jgi:hypothetical protein
MGAGFLDVYEITWRVKKTDCLYVNIYEKESLNGTYGP